MQQRRFAAQRQELISERKLEMQFISGHILEEIAMTELFVNESNSIEKAIASANEIDDAVRITVAEGRYEIGKTLKIKRDNITIEGISGKTILSGSKTIDISGMHGDNNIIRINLKEHGIFDYGKFGEGPYEEFWTKYDIPKPHMSDLGSGLEVFYEDSPLSNARYPKAGFIHVEKALGRTAIESEGKRIGSQEGIFLSDDENIKKWSTEKELLLIGYWNYDWATQRHMVKRIDASTGQIEVNGPYHVYGYREHKRTGFTETGGRFYAVNVLSSRARLKFQPRAIIWMKISQLKAVSGNPRNIAAARTTVTPLWKTLSDATSCWALCFSVAHGASW